MVDGFHCLRFYAVIRRNDQDRDIRRIGTAHTHRGKGFMSRRIQKRDLRIINVYSICTDRLCNTTGFLIRYICLADRIQKGCLTMVYVSHDADYRRTFHHLAHILFLFLQQFLNDIYLHFLLTDDIIFDRDILRLFIGDFRIQGHDLTGKEQLLDDNGRLHLHLVGKLLDGQLLRQRDHLDLFLHYCLFLFRLDKAACLVLQSRFLFLLVDHILSGAFVPVLISASFFILRPLFCRNRLCIHCKAFTLSCPFSGSCVSAIRSSTAPVIIKRFIPSSTARLTLLAILISRAILAFASSALVFAAVRGAAALPLSAAVIFPVLEFPSLTVSLLTASLPIVCARCLIYPALFPCSRSVFSDCFYCRFYLLLRCGRSARCGPVVIVLHPVPVSVIIGYRLGLNAGLDQRPVGIRRGYRPCAVPLRTVLSLRASLLPLRPSVSAASVRISVAVSVSLHFAVAGIIDDDDLLLLSGHLLRLCIFRCGPLFRRTLPRTCFFRLVFFFHLCFFRSRCILYCFPFHRHLRYGGSFLCRLSGLFSSCFEVPSYQSDRFIFNGTLCRFYFHTLFLQVCNDLFTLYLQLFRKFMYFHFCHILFSLLLTNASLFVRIPRFQLGLSQFRIFPSSILSSYFNSSIRFRIASANPLSVTARFALISFPIACPSSSLFP